MMGALLFLITASALTIAVVYNAMASKKDDSSPQTQQADTAQLTGTKRKDFAPLTKPLTKLEFTDTKVGTGREVKPGDTITADYVGWLADSGVIFDASKDHGGAQTFPLSGVIAGWSQGIPGMKVGGTRRLMIPAGLGYGAQGSGSSIPPNSDLVFDVTVDAIN